MGHAVDKIRVDVQARSGAGRARTLLHELSRRLAEPMAKAFEDSGLGEGTLLVPRLRLEVRIDLTRASADDVAAAIARACAEALLEMSIGGKTVTATQTDAAAVVAETVAGDQPVCCANVETEAAAWLVTRFHGSSTRLWKRSFEREFAHASIGSTLAALVHHFPNPRALLAALGGNDLDEIIRHCTEPEARAVLFRLDDGREPSAQTWRIVREMLRDRRLQLARAPYRMALRVCAQALRAEAPGASSAALTLAQEFGESVFPSANSLSAEFEAATHDVREVETVGNAWMPSDLTGLWCLLPALATLLRDVDEDSARRAAIGAALLLAGEDALDDPAIAAWGCDQSDQQSFAGSHRRLAVQSIRRFAQGLRGFERARCTYVLRAILSGPGAVRRVEDGWEATLPRSPLRIILDRSGLLGDVKTPWQRPALRLVHEEGA